MQRPPVRQREYPGLAAMAAQRGMIWAIIGVVFAFVFVTLAEYLRDIVPAPLHQVLATIGAAALTALFYSSMRLTVMVTNFTFIAMLVYMWGNTELILESLILRRVGMNSDPDARKSFVSRCLFVFRIGFGLAHHTRSPVGFRVDGPEREGFSAPS